MVQFITKHFAVLFGVTKVLCNALRHLYSVSKDSVHFSLVIGFIKLRFNNGSKDKRPINFSVVVHKRTFRI